LRHTAIFSGETIGENQENRGEEKRVSKEKKENRRRISPHITPYHFLSLLPFRDRHPLFVEEMVAKLIFYFKFLAARLTPPYLRIHEPIIHLSIFGFAHD